MIDNRLVTGPSIQELVIYEDTVVKIYIPADSDYSTPYLLNKSAAPILLSRTAYYGSTNSNLVDITVGAGLSNKIGATTNEQRVYLMVTNGTYTLTAIITTVSNIQFNGAVRNLGKAEVVVTNT